MTEDRDAEVTHDLSSFVAELRRLADALDYGTPFTIAVDGEEVAVPADAAMSVAHEREDGHVELEFQLTWSETGSTAQDDDEAEDTSEPEAEEPAA